MEVMSIAGGIPLRGEVSISGSKNAALPVMAASLLTAQSVELKNVPAIEDIGAMADILRYVGVEVDQINRSSWKLCAAEVKKFEVGAELTKRLRGSLLLLGALVARTGSATIAKPGGDDIGMRRVEQHLEGLRLMGAEILEEGDFFVAHAKKLKGARIDLDMPTVTGTENLMMAAVLAEGITVISNAAREPHVYDLARCLVGMGARISGAGTELIVIEGNGGLLHGTEHSVTTDYLEAGTYMVAIAATKGDGVVNKMWPGDVRWLINKLRAANCHVVEGANYMQIQANQLKSVDVTTWTHPGFATDLQSQFVALMTQAQGMSIVSERLFDNRFRHVEELCKLGAQITLEGRSAIINGPTKLRGAEVTVPDIRSGAALVVAALCAEGTTKLRQIFHLDRGYEDLDSKLRGLGAKIERQITDEETPMVRDFSNAVGD